MQIGLNYEAVRRSAPRLKAENASALDVNYLSRNGYLDDGNWKRLLWRQYGELRMEGLIKAYENHITIDSGVTTQKILLTQTPCPFGGYRRWLVCPSCNKSVGILYFRYKYFGCRLCQRISYQSESGNAKNRLLWRYHTLYEKLEKFNPKRGARYDRAYAKFLDVAWQFDEIVYEGLMQIVSEAVPKDNN